MEQFQLIAIAILSILWAISTYKWVRAEKKAKKVDERIFTLQHKNRNLELDLKGLETYKRFQETNRVSGYLVEVKEGIYLKRIINIDGYPKPVNELGILYGTCYDFVSIDQASEFRSIHEARVYARKCGGRILQLKPNLEVVE